MKKLLLLTLLFVACSSEEDESNDSDWVPKVDITLDYSILQGGPRPDGQPLRPYFPDFGKDENGLNIVILKDVDCFTSLKVRMDSYNGFTFARWEILQPTQNLPSGNFPNYNIFLSCETNPGEAKAKPMIYTAIWIRD
tara:strand:- start:47 stop:460 length:414 start_codon:yes stop_codon:yes gene_type:complete